MYALNYPAIGESSKFAFANACLAIIEKDMLTQSLIDQLKVADSMKEFFRMMADTTYAHVFEAGESIDLIVEKETIRAKEELYEILPEEVRDFLDVFYRKYDYNNLKILLKSHFTKKIVSLDELSKAGTISPYELLKHFEKEEYEEIPLNFSFNLFENHIRKTGELRIIETNLDRAYYQELLTQAVNLNDSFFLDFIHQHIDLKNILIFIRCKKTNIPMEAYLIDGGYITLDVYAKYLQDNIEILMSASEFYNYRHIIGNGLLSLKRTGSYAELETAIRNYLISNLTEVRDYFFTIKPFIAYLIAKEHEINLVKKIYLHISNRLDFGTERDLVYV